MPLTGTDQALRNAVQSTAVTVLRSHLEPQLPEGAVFPIENIEAMANAIAESVVVTLNHIIANGEVLGGIPVQTAGSAAAQTGATVSNGKIF